MKVARFADVQVQGKILGACDAQLTAFADACIERHVDAVLFAGDLFEKADILDGRAGTGAQIEVALRPFRRLRLANIPCVAIPGNHDMSGAGSPDALHVFDGTGVVVLRKPEAYVLDTPSGGSLSIYALPWSWAGGSADAALANLFDETAHLRLSSPSVLLGHAQKIGGIYGGVICEAKPHSWQLSTGALEAAPVDSIALGDFHRRQPHFVGAILQHNYGEGAYSNGDQMEAGNPTGFEIWDTETGLVEWVELTAAWRYMTHTITSEAAYKEAQLLEAVHVDHHHRFKFVGWKPPAYDFIGMSEAGIDVKQVVEHEERAVRIEVPDGAIGSPRALLDLYAKSQDPEWKEERLAAAYGALERVFAKPGAGGTPDDPCGAGIDDEPEPEEVAAEPEGALPF
jgi:hypothetical protein